MNSSLNESTVVWEVSGKTAMKIYSSGDSELIAICSENRGWKRRFDSSNRCIQNVENNQLTKFRINGSTSLRLDTADESLHSIYLQHKPELCAYLVKKLRYGLGEAEDVVQSAFEKMLKMSPQQFQQIRNIRAFLYKSAYNTALDQQRRAGVGQRFVAEQSSKPAEHIDSLDPYRRVLGDQQMQVLLAALKRMPEKRRKLIVMNRFDGLSCAEIARRVNLSETVVRKHLTRALAECQHALRLSSGELQK